MSRHGEVSNYGGGVIRQREESTYGVGVISRQGLESTYGGGVIEAGLCRSPPPPIHQDPHAAIYIRPMYTLQPSDQLTAEELS
eukprot:710826-Rhodomonas_salina.1